MAAALERLTQAPAKDLGRMERALADFCGLDPLEYYRACQLAIWTEADRVRPNRGRIPQVIAQQVADAVEHNVPPDLHVGGFSGWEPYVLAHVPLPEGLRMVQVASDRTDTTGLLRSLHPEEHSDSPSGESPTPKGAGLAIQERDRGSLRAWVSTLPGNEAFKDRWLRVLVPALAEADRLEEALEYLEEIGSQSVREAAVCTAISLCAEAGYDTVVQAFLSHLAPGANRVRCRVKLMCARLRLSGEVAAAAAEMEAIEGEVESKQGGEECAEGKSHLVWLNRGFSLEVRHELAVGWWDVVWARLDVGQFWEALDAAKHVFSQLRRSNCMMGIFAEAQRRVSGDEVLRLAKAVLRAAEEFDSFDHTEAVLRRTIEFLARSGSPAALQLALSFIEAKMPHATSSIRDEHRQNALRIFASSPPNELSWEETAAVGNGISSAAIRADCLYALALHAAVEDEWDQCERLERTAKRIMETVDPESTEAQLSGGFGEIEEKPGIPEMLRWIRSRRYSEEVQSEPNQWFSEAIALATSLRHFPEVALYGVGRLLIESPPFPERGDLYRETLKQLKSVSGFFDTSLFRNELSLRAENAFWDPLDAELPAPEEHQKMRTSESGGDADAPHPRLLRKKFDAALAQIEERREAARFVSNFLKKAVSRILHPIRKPVAEALFEAARRIRSTHTKIQFLAMVHALAMEQGDTTEARWVAEAARCFAREAEVLSEYETEVNKRLLVEAGGEAQPRKDELKEGAAAPDFEAAFVELEAAPDVWRAISLFNKALATGDSQLFFRAFELAEEGFAIETSHGRYSMIFESVSDWPRLIGKLSSRADRAYLLRRMWNWYDWFRLQDNDCGILFVPSWAGQMAAVGEINLALETVERLRYLEHRANGYAEVAIGCGLTRGDARGAELFARFVNVAKELAATEEHQCGADLGVRRIAMVCAEEGDHHHLLEVVALGMEMLRSNKPGDAHFCLLLHLLEALSLANRTDAWGELLDCLIQSEQTTRWHSGQMSSVVYSLWKDCRHDPKAFRLSDRLGFLERFCVMMAAVRPVKQWGHNEARLLQICLSQSEDIPQIQERFEAVSSCSPEVVESLLGQSLALRPDQDLPAAPDDQMLRWLANLCPYSEAAAHHLIGHVADRCLHENNWSALLTLAEECHSLDLDWLKNIAEAVLAGE